MRWPNGKPVQASDLIEGAVFEFDAHRAIVRPISHIDHFGPATPSKPHPWSL
jgi:hypothetical protein